MSGDRLLPLGSSAAVRYLLLAESPGAQGRRVRSAISPGRAFLRLPALARQSRERSPLFLALPVSLPYPLFLPSESLLSLALSVRSLPPFPLVVSSPRPSVHLSSSRISPIPFLFLHGPHLSLFSFSLSVPVSFWFLTSESGPAQERLLVPQFLTEGGGLASELRSWPHRPRSSVWELGFSSGSSGCVSNSWSPQSFPKLFSCACPNLRPIERVSIAFCRSPAQKRLRTALGSKRRRGFRRPQVPRVLEIWGAGESERGLSLTRGEAPVPAEISQPLPLAFCQRNAWNSLKLTLLTIPTSDGMHILKSEILPERDGVYVCVCACVCMCERERETVKEVFNSGCFEQFL